MYKIGFKAFWGAFWTQQEHFCSGLAVPSQNLGRQSGGTQLKRHDPCWEENLRMKSKNMTWRDFAYLMYRPDFVGHGSLPTSRESFPKHTRASAQDKKHQVKLQSPLLFHSPAKKNTTQVLPVADPVGWLAQQPSTTLINFPFSLPLWQIKATGTMTPRFGKRHRSLLRCF